MAGKMWASSIIFSIFFAVSASTDNVPVIFWSNTGSQLPVPLAAATTSGKTFRNMYLKQLVANKGHNLVTFIQNKLSLDDITQNGDVYNEESNGGVFHNLKTLMDTHDSMHLSSVQSPVDALDALKKQFEGRVHELRAPYDVASLTLESGGGNLIVTHLPDNGATGSLANIDAVLGSVSAAIKALGRPFSAIYTAKESSVEPSPESLYTGRHLLDDAEDVKPSFFNVSSCLFLYFDQLQFILTSSDAGGAETFNLPSYNASDASSSCANNTGILSVTYPQADLPTGMSAFSFKMNMSKSASGYWAVNSLSASYTMTMNGSGTDIGYITKAFSSPVGFSYHCTSPNALAMADSNATAPLISKIKFENIQTQMGIKNNQFGMADDCTGFFTIPIWMGLFTTLILLLILTCGIAMVANINTMDRFDDPKGKTLTVNVNE